MSERILSRKLSDGTRLVWFQGDNEHQNHWHIAPDGTVLSVKEGGDHKYNRGQIRKNLLDVLNDLGIMTNAKWLPDPDGSRARFWEGWYKDHPEDR
jgi:hypothetical protein